LLDELPKKFRPRFASSLDSKGMVMSFRSMLPLLQAFSVSFVVHYNALPYFQKFSDQMNADGSEAAKQFRSRIIGPYRRFAVMTLAVLSVVGLVYSSTMASGYRLFGLSAQPLILNNFPAWNDKLAVGVRAAVTITLFTFAYPSMFSALLVSVEGLMGRLMNSLRRLLDRQPLNEYTLLALSFAEGMLRRVFQSEDTTGTVSKNTVRSMSQSNRLKLSLCLHLLMSAFILFSRENLVSNTLTIFGATFGSTLAYTLPSLLELRHLQNRSKVGLAVSKVKWAVNVGVFILGLLSLVTGCL
jgi:hypothetical protein